MKECNCKEHPLFIQMSKVVFANFHDTITPGEYGGCPPGTFVSVRPRDTAKYEKRQYLGIFLCCAPTGILGKQEDDKVVLTIEGHSNPAIYIIETNTIVWGAESWWGPVQTAEEAKELCKDEPTGVICVEVLAQLAVRQEIKDLAEKEGGQKSQSNN